MPRRFSRLLRALRDSIGGLLAQARDHFIEAANQLARSRNGLFAFLDLPEQLFPFLAGFLYQIAGPEQVRLGVGINRHGASNILQKGSLRLLEPTTDIKTGQYRVVSQFEIAKLLAFVRPANRLIVIGGGTTCGRDGAYSSILEAGGV
jgi:hypothetical protein